MQSHDLASLGVDAQRAQREVPFVGGDGSVAWGSAAIALSLKRCGMPWTLLGDALRLPLVRAASRAAYALVARNRHRLPGGTDACELPR